MPPSDVVIDLSHHNQAVLSTVRQAGIMGVIHKATGGAGFQDPKYAPRRQEAQVAGLLWGAYHFGTGSADGVTQAEFFLHTVDPSAGMLLVLDLEENPLGPNMTLDQAHAFVSHVQSITGKWPGLYGGGYIRPLVGGQVDPIFQNCWLWLAQYGPNAVVPPPWPAWTFWQYTENGVVSGVTGNCDRDRFNGTLDELTAFWQSQSPQHATTATASAGATTGTNGATTNPTAPASNNG